MARPAPVWLLLLLAATLGGLAALALEQGVSLVAGVTSQDPAATPPPTTPAPVAVIVLPTISSTAAPTAASGDTAAEVAALRSQVSQQAGLLLVARAERHTGLAAEALTTNDFAGADRELVAARSALDSAFGLVAEDLKQVIDGQRREVGRMRSDLHLNPEGMGERLRATQDLLLGLIVPPVQ